MTEEQQLARAAGSWGEKVAVEAMERSGAHVIGTNVRVGNLEVDILACQDEDLIITEVKTRSDMSADPLLAVNRRKMQRLSRAAVALLEKYSDERGVDYHLRFDFVLVTGSPEHYTVEHLEDRYQPPCRFY